jgi:flavin-dependent dehydrogenase
MTRKNGSSNYDAVIIGARPAGAATAMLLARAGARVMLVDRQMPGTDTVSTHAMLRGAVVLLARWGLLGKLAEANTPWVRRTTFNYEDTTVAIDLKPENGIEGLMAPRRYVLDRVLAETAVEAGADARFGSTFKEICTGSDGRVTGVVLQHPGGNLERVMADIVIGADGRLSTVARHVGAETYRTGRHASATVYGYVGGIPNAGYRWIFRDGLSAGAIPTTGGAHCVFASVRPEEHRKIFGDDPMVAIRSMIEPADGELAAHLVPAGLEERFKRFAGAPSHLRRCQGTGWALVGDAGYFKDPVTAHGITDALRDADLLASTIIACGAGNLTAYERERDRHSRAFLDLTDQIAALDWTAPRVRALHERLNHLMKAEVTSIRSRQPATALAA